MNIAEVESSYFEDRRIGDMERGELLGVIGCLLEENRGLRARHQRDLDTLLGTPDQPDDPRLKRVPTLGELSRRG